MDHRWQITPELCGTNWFRIALISGGTALAAVGLDLLIDTHRSILFGSAVFVIIWVWESISVHQKLRYELHLADDYISVRYPSDALDVIHKNDIAKIRDARPLDPRGDGLVVMGPHRLLQRQTEIFIPRALPELFMIQQILGTWMQEATLNATIPLTPRGLPYSQ